VKQEAAALMDKARRSLEAARVLEARGFHEQAVSDAYYAMFHAGEALLAEKGLDHNSHRGVLSGVGQHYTRLGLLDRELSRRLHVSFELRLEADHEVSERITSATAQESIAWAEAFIAAAGELLVSRTERTEDDST